MGFQKVMITIVTVRVVASLSLFHQCFFAWGAGAALPHILAMLPAPNDFYWYEWVLPSGNFEIAG
jgi:hypothetical protein